MWGVIGLAENLLAIPTDCQSPSSRWEKTGRRAVVEGREAGGGQGRGATFWLGMVGMLAMVCWVMLAGKIRHTFVL